MPLQLFTNNAQSQLSGVLPQGGNTLVCTASHGSRFPTPSAGNFFYLTIFIKDTYGVEQQSEIVKVTARIGDVFTIVRDIETITGQSGGYAYDATTDPVFLEVRWTAGCVNNLLQKGEAAIVAASGSYSDLINTPNFGTAAFLAGPVAGNATATELVKGNDSRLSDERTPVAHNQAWSTITSKPTTIATYGITDAYTKTEVDTALSGKGVGDVTSAGTQTLTNKTISAASNTITTAASGNLAATTLNAALAELQTDIDTRAPSSTAVTVAGTQTLINKKLSTFYVTERTVTNAVATGAISFDLNEATIFNLTLSGNVSITVSAAPTLENETLSFVVKVSQGSTPYSLTWFANIQWLTSGGTAPSAPSANKTTEYIFTTTAPNTYVGRKGAAS